MKRETYPLLAVDDVFFEKVVRDSLVDDVYVTLVSGAGFPSVRSSDKGYYAVSHAGSLYFTLTPIVLGKS